mmetsp:Transcript_7475/g.23911  ORF Transcript_7475/g.23911 Transcript_7475/m.23911 type:complete len:221 (+) Transcript_7475:421-1083(+)
MGPTSRRCSTQTRCLNALPGSLNFSAQLSMLVPEWRLVRPSSKTLPIDPSLPTSSASNGQAPACRITPSPCLRRPLLRLRDERRVSSANSADEVQEACADWPLARPLRACESRHETKKLRSALLALKPSQTARATPPTPRSALPKPARHCATACHHLVQATAHPIHLTSPRRYLGWSQLPTTTCSWTCTFPRPRSTICSTRCSAKTSSMTSCTAQMAFQK